MKREVRREGRYDQSHLSQWIRVSLEYKKYDMQPTSTSLAMRMTARY